MLQRKKQRTCPEITDKSDLFDGLPDDLVVSILCNLSSSASCPSDFIKVLLTCKRLNRLGLHPLVLSKAGPKALAVKARNWSDSAHCFLKHCVAAGNAEACYTLGMIRFYCLQNRGSGASLMAKAAIKYHAAALYSLAVIQFNGSGGSKYNKDLQAGVALCARAAFLGHVDALRELGHCLQDGYGVRQNVTEGRRLLLQANARELVSSLNSLIKRQPQQQHKRRVNYQHYTYRTGSGSGSGCPLLSDFGCNVPAPEGHPVNTFLKEWFESGVGELGQGLRLCSHKGCGRPETRANEFRRCSVCGTVNYCSRGCQALDWKLRHKVECVPIERRLEEGGNENGGDAGAGRLEAVGEAEDVAID
ncbi:F-box protein At1g67340-like [Durio zibethinus]|uniref:F-box protein At1g67340-like n=1 Tax=Durio zibethinus TaxID=66656 RepID=A0A6P6BGG5_DURZI|nr:F-box protein At1g67340-like [Durio zibethinus]XP_022776202.1 F-box protein At1g67340-like [Durio zibethinus]